MIRPGTTASVRVADGLGFTVLREDELLGSHVTMYSPRRPTPPMWIRALKRLIVKKWSRPGGGSVTSITPGGS
ncbi:hypothetical protein [Streptomyces sp. enrichment culture]|uniref:hypothetical protein n=1 Tax=Streptomyces sp. enrichment culture TaxID=1795815 RepID=UPI003F5694C0